MCFYPNVRRGITVKNFLKKKKSMAHRKNKTDRQEEEEVFSLCRYLSLVVLPQALFFFVFRPHLRQAGLMHPHQNIKIKCCTDRIPGQTLQAPNPAYKHSRDGQHGSTGMFDFYPSIPGRTFFSFCRRQIPLVYYKRWHLIITPTFRSVSTFRLWGYIYMEVRSVGYLLCGPERWMDRGPTYKYIYIYGTHTACIDEFRRNLRSHSWSVFSFLIIINIYTERFFGAAMMMKKAD